MATKRNNNKVGKSFAISTKIEYNGKLYEVVEGNYCDNCAIANICSSSDISASNRNDGVLSRDKRINIFGECSILRRPDSKSIVFIEIPKDNTKNKYYKIEPLFRDDTSTELKPVEFDLPNGYVIDKEHSDFDKGIIAFKNKWLTLEQLYKLAEENNFNTYRDSIKNISGNKLLALANLMDIARYFNGNWKYDVNKENVGYMIAYDISIPEPHYSVRENDCTVDIYYGNPIFKNEADAQYVIDNPNFRDILDSIFKV